jgi:hypothetical protein
MKKLITMVLAGVSIVASAATPNSLRFNPNEYTVKSLKMVDGTEVKFKAYEGIYYVTNVEDSTYQTLNFYVPEQLANGDQTPILLRTYVGGYMAATAKTPSATDATGRALQEGYAVCIPGSRGSNSMVTDGKKATLGKEIQERIYIMNPMNFIGGESDSQPAKHWYIRHGAKDRDTSFLVPVNLALKLQNAGYDVNLALPWNRPHSGDYNLDDLFAWIQSVVK